MERVAGRQIKGKGSITVPAYKGSLVGVKNACLTYKSMKWSDCKVECMFAWQVQGRKRSREGIQFQGSR
eukprot:1158896-Pelagomonas_calceolata.AAC.9